jgi:hypothetical protein
MSLCGVFNQSVRFYLFIFNYNLVDTRWHQYSTHLVDTRWQQYITHLVDTRWQQYSTHLVDTQWQKYITHLVDTRWLQYTFTHKQYTEYTERNVHNKSKKMRSTGRDQSLQVIPWYLPYN